MDQATSKSRKSHAISQLRFAWATVEAVRSTRLATEDMSETKLPDQLAAASLGLYEAIETIKQERE